jgi:hypothetical protein
MKTKIIPAVIATLLFAGAFSFAFAEDEKLDFASALEETLGHLHALELNLDNGNSELALVHATHPIAELYELMKPELQEHDAELDAMFETTLKDLGGKTNDVSREDAQKAIDELRSLVEDARMSVVGEELSNDNNFKMSLIQKLLETSAVEYAEAVENGAIKEMIEFQDGSAFVWKSQQIFDEIKSELPEHEVEEIEELYTDLWNAYDTKATPDTVQTLANGIIHEIDEISGEEHEEGLETYFENIERLLADTKDEYAEGNTDKALSLATKAYLDNYEFLEGPIAEHDKELMEEIEVMLREDLRNMIKNGDTTDEINSQIDQILEKLEQAEDLVEYTEESELHESEESEHKVIAPLKQVESGIEPKQVNCGTEMQLIIKNSDDSPACVKPTTAEKLVQLGWGTIP